MHEHLCRARARVKTRDEKLYQETKGGRATVFLSSENRLLPGARPRVRR